MDTHIQQMDDTQGRGQVRVYGRFRWLSHVEARRSLPENKQRNLHDDTRPNEKVGIISSHQDEDACSLHRTAFLASR